jgi:hypothetical protein
MASSAGEELGRGAKVSTLVRSMRAASGVTGVALEISSAVDSEARVDGVPGSLAG